MAKDKLEKTNALRLLDRKKVPYRAYTYPCEEFTDGEEVARLLGLPPGDVCKTLVTLGKSGGHYVFSCCRWTGSWTGKRPRPWWGRNRWRCCR